MYISDSQERFINLCYKKEKKEKRRKKKEKFKKANKKNRTLLFQAKKLNFIVVWGFFPPGAISP